MRLEFSFPFLYFPNNQRTRKKITSNQIIEREKYQNFLGDEREIRKLLLFLHHDSAPTLPFSKKSLTTIAKSCFFSWMNPPIWSTSLLRRTTKSLIATHTLQLMHPPSTMSSSSSQFPKFPQPSSPNFNHNWRWQPKTKFSIQVKKKPITQILVSLL